jgi:hypothetical protein
MLVCDLIDRHAISPGFPVWVGVWELLPRRAFLAEFRWSGLAKIIGFGNHFLFDDGTC